MLKYRKQPFFFLLDILISTLAAVTFQNNSAMDMIWNGYNMEDHLLGKGPRNKDFNIISFHKFKAYIHFPSQ